MPANPTPLSHAQAAPNRHMSRREMQEQSQEHAHTTMMPPPLPVDMNVRPPQSGFRPAGQHVQPHPVRRSHANPANAQRNAHPMLHQPTARHAQQPQVFRAPPTPRNAPQPQAGPSSSRRFSNTSSMDQDSGSETLQSNRYHAAPASLSTQRFVPSTPSGRQRFSTPAPVPGPSHSGLMRTSTDLGGSRAPSRTSGNGQRMPFVPGGQGGFG